MDAKLKITEESGSMPDIEAVLKVLNEVPAAGAVEINGQTSDGFHTFDELYEHRLLLTALLFQNLPAGTAASGKILWPWRSRLHSDGSEMEGWFVVGVELPTGTVTYHYPNSEWDLFETCETLDRAPEWDGHSSVDVLQRLRDALPLV